MTALAWPCFTHPTLPLVLIEQELQGQTVQVHLKFMLRWSMSRVCVCVCVLVTQLCLTLCNPMDCSSPGSSVHGILQARILEWVTILQGIFPTQGSNLGLPHCRQILYRLSDKGNVTYTHILLDRGGCMVKAKVNRIRGILHKGKNDKGEVGGGNRWFEHVTQFSTGGVRSVSY